MLTLPTIRVAAVQAAPIYLDTNKTIEKARALVAEAAADDADLIAFPEAFVPGYPYWNWTMTPIQGSAWFKRLAKAAIDIPGPEVDALCEAAAKADAHVVIGVNERSPHSFGTLYNSQLFISNTGELLGVHRKLVPTWAEKLTWGGGDGSSIRVYDTHFGKLGGLICGENTNTLARFALLAQGEIVHVASYIAQPIGPDGWDMIDGIKIRAAAHSLEGKVFTVVSSSVMTQEIIDAVAHDSVSRTQLSKGDCTFSGVFGPSGSLLTQPLGDEEGIVLGDIDLEECIQPKQLHDIVGDYNRFDVFNLTVNRQRLNPVTLNDPACVLPSSSAEPADQLAPDTGKTN